MGSAGCAAHPGRSDRSVCLPLDKQSRTDYNRREIGVLFNGEQEDYVCVFV